MNNLPYDDNSTSAPDCAIELHQSTDLNIQSDGADMTSQSNGAVTGSGNESNLAMNDQSVIDGLAMLNASLDVQILDPSLKVNAFGECSPELDTKFESFFEKHDNGYNFHESLHNLKSFSNPSTLSKITKMYNIDQYGSNF